MKMHDMRKLDDTQLSKQITEQQAEMMNLRFQNATGALENPSRLTYVKRTIARLMTVQNERGPVAAPAKAEPTAKAATPAPEAEATKTEESSS